MKIYKEQKIAYFGLQISLGCMAVLAPRTFSDFGEDFLQPLLFIALGVVTGITMCADYVNERYVDGRRPNPSSDA